LLPKTPKPRGVNYMKLIGFAGLAQASFIETNLKLAQGEKSLKLSNSVTLKGEEKRLKLAFQMAD